MFELRPVFWKLLWLRASPIWIWIKRDKIQEIVGSMVEPRATLNKVKFEFQLRQLPRVCKAPEHGETRFVEIDIQMEFSRCATRVKKASRNGYINPRYGFVSVILIISVYEQYSLTKLNSLVSV